MGGMNEEAIRIPDDDWERVSKNLDDLTQQIERIDAVCHAINAAPESPINEAFWRVADMLINEMEISIGDDNKTISWWVYECRCGISPLSAGRDENMRVIDSHDALRWIIELK